MELVYNPPNKHLSDISDRSEQRYTDMLSRHFCQDQKWEMWFYATEDFSHLGLPRDRPLWGTIQHKMLMILFEEEDTVETLLGRCLPKFFTSNSAVCLSPDAVATQQTKARKIGNYPHRTSMVEAHMVPGSDFLVSESTSVSL